MFSGMLTGPDLTAALDSEIARVSEAIATGLATFDPVVTPRSWHRILQGAEELINFLTEPLDDEDLHDAIAGLPLPAVLGPRRSWFEESVRNLYDGGIEIRMLEVLELAYATDMGFAAHGMPLGLATVADVAGYLHTVRRRMVSLFY